MSRARRVRTQGRAMLLPDRARAEGLPRSAGAGLHATAFAFNATPLPRTSSAARPGELHANPWLHAMVYGQVDRIMLRFILAARPGPFAEDAVARRRNRSPRVCRVAGKGQARSAA
jgi:hypothetical protein